MTGTKIQSISYQKVFSSVGTPSLEVLLTSDNGTSVTAAGDGGQNWSGLILPALEQWVTPLILARETEDLEGIDSDLLTTAQAHSDIAPFIPIVSRAVLNLGAKVRNLDLCAWLKHFAKLEGRIPMPMSGAVAAGIGFAGAAPTYEGKPWWGYVASGFDSTADAINALWVVQQKWQDLIKQQHKVKVNVHRGNLFYPKTMFPDIHSLCSSLTQAISDSAFEGKVTLFADLNAPAFFDPAAGCYTGCLSGSATEAEHLELLLALCRGYPISLLIDPLGKADAEGYRYLTELCPLVCSRDGHTGLVPELFDTMTVSQWIGTARAARDQGKPLVPQFSLSAGFDAMDYYTALEITTGFRCGMTDFGNRAMELSGTYKQTHL